LWCAEEGFAPELIAFEQLPGGWYMVVMDFLDDSWITAAQMRTDTETLPEDLEDKVHAAITKLHQNHMVHGDLRDTNLLIKQARRSGSDFMLIDYDRAGGQGQVTYPRNINKGERLCRPDEVEDGKPICSHHDIFMLHHLFRVSSS